MTASAEPLAAPAAPARLWESAVLGVCCLALYALLGQEVFYKTDGPDLLWMLHEGDMVHPWQLAYLPLLDGFRWLLSWAELELLTLGSLFSAVGMAMGVAAFHSGLRVLRIGREEALLAALLLALNPGALMFGTVVEFHGPLIGVVGVAFWWLARVVRRPSWGGMVGLGALSHAAFLMHSTAVFLPALFLPWFLAMRRGRGTWGRDFGLAVLAGVVHVALFAGLPQLVPGFYGDYVDLSGAFARESRIGRPQSLDYGPTILWQEWLWPLLPLSVAFLPAFWARVRTLRLEAWAMVIGFLPFLYLSVRLLVFAPERGAYMLPLLLPAARLTAAVLPRACLLVLVLGSAIGGIVAVQVHDDPTPYQEWEAGLREAGGEYPVYVFVAMHREKTMSLARLHPVAEFAYVQQLAAMPRENLTEQDLVGTVAYINGLRLQGHRVFITKDTVEFLEDPATKSFEESGRRNIKPADQVAGPLILERLRLTQRFEPVTVKGFEGFRLLPK